MMSDAKCKIAVQEDSVVRLAQLGIDEQDIHNAITSALYERRRTSKLHPVIDGGFRFWSQLVAALRGELIAKDLGWSSSRQNRMELVHNSKLGINLVITAGDKDTGKPDGWPKTKNAKGEATMSIVNSNSETLDLFPIEPSLFSTDGLQPAADTTQNYIVLYYYDSGNKEVRCEVSLPIGMAVVNGFAKVNSWAERIVLAPIPFDGGEIILDEDFIEEIDIDVVRI
ncbi:TPA: hypothetical protein ACHTGR_005046 [Serratia marcescens subsp. marcescens ATCC 13880]|uniref:hypothetical protein n=1 Tax=Serratia TaxID=613 RepID=UPI000EFA456A|nr:MULTISPECIES: hypothetical protein [Serratia]